MDGKKDLRRTHSSQAVSARQSEPVVVVGVSLDFVSAVGVLGVRQECVLEPGYEFALKKPPQSLSAPSSHTWSTIEPQSWAEWWEENEPPCRHSGGPSPREQCPRYCID